MRCDRRRAEDRRNKVSSRPAVTRRALLDSHTMSHELAIMLLSPLSPLTCLARNKRVIRKNKEARRERREKEEKKKGKKKRRRKQRETITLLVAATVLHQTDGEHRGAHHTHTHTRTPTACSSFYLFLSSLFSPPLLGKNRQRKKKKKKKGKRARASHANQPANFYPCLPSRQVFFTRACSTIPDVYRSSYG